MVHDPRRGDKQQVKGASLLFFVVAILVMAVGAALEQLQHVPTQQIRSDALLILLLLALVLFAARLRRTRR